MLSFRHFILIILLILNFSSFSQGLPDDFPEMNILVHDNPEPGYIFLSPCGLWNIFPEAEPYLSIVDNHGTPVFYLKLTAQAFDFKLQPNGYLSFHDGGFGYAHFLMDSSYAIIDTVTMKNYWVDFHDFRVLENGNYLMIGAENRIIDMDTVVAGGHPGVTVRGNAIEEQDPDENVIWEWSAWDHYKITDVNEDYVDLTDSSFIDWVHCNAVDQDTDSTMLLCPRNFDEITKINKNTGEIIWRLGGENNDFTYTGDTLGFSAQHHIRRLPDGNYLLFDNGWQMSPCYSSALEFTLDEENMVANFIKRYRSCPEDIMSWSMGSSQRLPGGNTLVGWGSATPSVTEFKPDGSKALEIEFEAVSYRAFKFPWKTNLISFAHDTLDFGTANAQDTLMKDIEVINHSENNFPVTTIHSNTNKFYNASTLPVAIPPDSSVKLNLMFIPGEEGYFEDVITVCWDIENEDMTRRIAGQYHVKGQAAADFGIDEPNDPDITFFPNPSTGTARLRYQVSDTRHLIVDIHEITGRKIKNLLRKNVQPGVYEWQTDLGDLPTGVYLVRIITGNQTITKKLVIK